MKTTVDSEYQEYVVVRIDNGQVGYEGSSLVAASLMLDPGTCYGKGSDMHTAMARCLSWRKFFLKQKELANGNSVRRN